MTMEAEYMIDKNELKYLAALAEIEFSEEELEEVRSRIETVLDHLDTVKSVDTTGVKPTTHVIGIENVYREDDKIRPLSLKDALKNAPDVLENGFKIPDIP
jgi:aspartyl-tRNA(Asn)/glutamyl-tRNA(Gln) amidotransferase subunit C